ncbi:hypothetical protein [Terrihalobacillus insolitus]|uniref:hypothetical protein n=1 Tax=Terrihalobacillus insolitus TaxID=2950438 RepID=UPI00233FBC74|nr:hypothetical protein [Terrihalobacillus insolitus]MDC3412932.1 hypothetical protein [Terrihalobacillus insolitus]
MYIIGGFECNTNLELALYELEELGFREEDIFIVEMKHPRNSERLINSIHSSDGKSLMDSITAWGVVVGTLGIIYGSQLLIGPIATGLLGLVVGAMIGFLTDLKVNKNKKKKRSNIDVLLIIHCKTEEREEKIKKILQKFLVVTIGVHK